MPIRLYCTFRVERLWLGLDVLDVQEVIRHPETTRVPTASDFVEGLINLRGQIVTVLNLRNGLGLGRSSTEPRAESPMDVIVRAPAGGWVGLVVDELGDVLEFEESAIEPTPETLTQAIRRLVSGLYWSAGQSLLILDLEQIVDADGRP